MEGPNTDQNISKYRVVTFQCFTHEQVKEINKEIKKNITQKEDSSNVASYAYKKGDFSIVPCGPLMTLLFPWTAQCQQANRKSFGYNVNWDFHLDTFNYNKYEIDDEYGWHIDLTPEKYDMKLTCLLNLSEEPYEGGEFKVVRDEWDEKKEMKFDSGMGLMVNPLLIHKVTPITKGERITLTYWGIGPAWK